MSITPKNKSSKAVSERERFIGFVYVLTLFIVITGACGFSSMQGHATSSPIK